MWENIHACGGIYCGRVKRKEVNKEKLVQNNTDRYKGGREGGGGEGKRSAAISMVKKRLEKRW